MTPEDADRMWWEEMRKLDWHESSGKRETQHEMRMRCWTTVMSHIRNAYQAENERLRARVRELGGAE